MKETQHITVQYRVKTARVPAAATLRAWAQAALEGIPAEVTLRIVDETESAALNSGFRGKNGPTNVLSFGYDFALPENLRDNIPPPLGDLVICKPVVLRQANEQRIAARAHWAHMVVHGILHLRGMDHIEDAQAAQMENHEREILARLGFEDPYRDETTRTAHAGATS